MSVLSQSTLQPVPSHSQAVGKAFWGRAPCSPTGGRAAGDSPQRCGEPGATQCRPPAGTAWAAEGPAPHEPEGCSEEHKGSPIPTALPWNAAWEPLPNANLFLIIRPGCRLIPAPSPLEVQPRPASRQPSNFCTASPASAAGQTRVRAGIPLQGIFPTPTGRGGSSESREQGWLLQVQRAGRQTQNSGEVFRCPGKMDAWTDGHEEAGASLMCLQTICTRYNQTEHLP